LNCSGHYWGLNRGNITGLLLTSAGHVILCDLYLAKFLFEKNIETQTDLMNSNSKDFYRIEDINL